MGRLRKGRRTESPMTHDQLNETLHRLSWSRVALAARLGMSNDRAIRRWANGTYPVPPAIADWLLLVAQTLEDMPPPENWRNSGSGDSTHDA
jgi:hypothetical protein